MATVAHRLVVELKGSRSGQSNIDPVGAMSIRSEKRRATQSCYFVPMAETWATIAPLYVMGGIQVGGHFVIVLRLGLI